MLLIRTGSIRLVESGSGAIHVVKGETREFADCRSRAFFQQVCRWNVGLCARRESLLLVQPSQRRDQGQRT